MAEDRLLTDEDFAEEQRKYMEENHLFCFPLEGWRRDDCNRKAQQALTAAAKDRAHQKEITELVASAQRERVYMELKVDEVKAECQARVREIFEEIELYLRLGRFHDTVCTMYFTDKPHPHCRLCWWRTLKEKWQKEGVE